MLSQTKRPVQQSVGCGSILHGRVAHKPAVQPVLCPLFRAHGHVIQAFLPGGAYGCGGDVGGVSVKQQRDGYLTPCAHRVQLGFLPTICAHRVLVDRLLGFDYPEIRAACTRV